MNEEYISQAIKLALKAQGKTSPNPMVGAVIVKDGQIVGQGYHQASGLPHAEINALIDAGPQANEATIYLNLEPCSHYGKTPPCTKAIIEAGIKKVVISMLDPNPLVHGVEELKKAGLEVITGVLEEKAKNINEAYIKYITTKLPFVTLKLAITLDGKITLQKQRWISGEKSRKMVHQLRSQVDAIMVGRGTILADAPLLTCRIKGGKDPLVVIVDSRLGIPLSARALQRPQRVIIAVTNYASLEKRADFEKSGAKILITEETNGQVDMQDLMVKLGQLSVTSLLVEGGSKVSAAALQAGIVDKILFFVAPKIAGMRQRDAVADLNSTINIKNMSVKRVGEDLLITGYVNK